MASQVDRGGRKPDCAQWQPTNSLCGGGRALDHHVKQTARHPPTL